MGQREGLAVSLSLTPLQINYKEQQRIDKGVLIVDNKLKNLHSPNGCSSDFQFVVATFFDTDL